MLYKYLIILLLLTNSISCYKTNLLLRNNIVKCNICNLNVDKSGYIPENCTIPLGCPYNKEKIFTNNSI